MNNETRCIYRAVGSHIAVVPADLRLPISNDRAEEILCGQGFRRLTPNIAYLASSLVGNVRYRRGARMSEAPAVLDCSSLTKWVYGQMGIWIPRRAIQQRATGKTIPLSEVRVGDLIFTSGWRDRYDTDLSDGVGHVGIVVGNARIIHAANRKVGVVETPLETFTGRGFRGAARFVEDFTQLTVFETPVRWEVETSDDLRWIILYKL